MLEWLEDALLILDRDSRTCVDDADERITSFPPTPNNHAALFGEATGIAEEIDGNLAHACLIAKEWRQIGFHVGFEIEPARFIKRLNHAERVADQRRQVHPGAAQCHAACLHLAQVQHIIDQRRQVLSVASNRRDIGQERCGKAPAINVRRTRNHIGEADDHVQRRAQFMADVGDELGLGLARLLGHEFEHLQSLGKPRQFAVGVDQVFTRLLEFQSLLAHLIQIVARRIKAGHRPVCQHEEFSTRDPAQERAEDCCGNDNP